MCNHIACIEYAFPRMKILKHNLYVASGIELIKIKHSVTDERSPY